MNFPLTGRAGKIAYAIGSIGDTGFYQVITAFLLFFLIETVHLDSLLAGLAYALAFGAWNAINDPIIGVLSDRTRTRLGRRRPWIITGAPLTFLFFILLWSVPTGGKSLANPYDMRIFFYVLIILAGWAWTYSMCAVTWFALYPEMWESVEDRTEVVVYRQLLAIIGGALAVAVFPILLDSMSKKFGGFNGWIVSAGIVGVIFAGSYLLSLLGIKERKEFSMEKTLSIVESLKLTFTNKTLLTYAGMDLMTWCMTGWLSATMPFFATHSLHVNLADVSLLLAPSMVGIMAFFPIWRKFYLKYGPKVTLGAASIWFAIAFLPCLLVQNILQASLWAFSVGAGMSGVVVAREVMMGDVVDEDEVRTGYRREGSYFGAFMAIEKLSFVIVGLSTTFLLSTLIGYVPGKPEPSFMNFGLRIGMTIFTAIYVGVLLIFLGFYPLGKKEVDSLRRKIEKIHAEKAKKLRENREN